MPARTKSRRFAGIRLPGIGHNEGRKPLYKEHRLTFVEGRQETDENPFPQDNSFLFSTNAKAISLDVASGFQEDIAREAFKAIRWPGGPTCPRCAAADPYELTRRQMWDCRACGTHFSLTSGTIFSSHKLSFRSICMALAITVGASPIDTAREAVAALAVNYRTAWRLINNLRTTTAMPPLDDRTKEPTFEIDCARYIDGRLYSTRTWWTPPEKEAVVKLINGGHSPETVAPVLGRTASSIAWYARDIDGLKLPKDWAALIKSKQIASPRRIPLAYPFIMKSRPEHADLIALNDLVPRAYPDQMRADICQEMMLAVLEGTTTVDEIKANRDKSSWFLKKFYMSNYEQSGYAISLSGINEDDERTYDEVASSIAAQDWHQGQVHERTKFVNSLSIGFQPPTQIDDVWRSQINQAGRFLTSMGKGMAFEEVAALVESGEFKSMEAGEHATKRAKERLRINLDRKALAAIANYIGNGHAKFAGCRKDGKSQFVVPWGGKEMMVVYAENPAIVVTVFPVAQKTKLNKD